MHTTADVTAEPPTDEAAAPLPQTARAFAAVWVIFWVLLALIAVQDHWRQGHADLWRPLLAEGSSAAVASALVAALWRQLPQLDHRLASPRRWLAWPLLAMLPAGLLFVVVVQALRMAAHGAIGQVYQHDPWPVLLAYETAKFCIFYLLFVAVLFGLRSHAALRGARERALQQQALAREAQLVQLAQQIEPHFLFNALNTIAGTVHAAPDLADDLITRLALLLRASMTFSRQPLVPLADELALASAYVAIMQARTGPRVQVGFDIAPDAVGCQVPVLLLQPLLENAFRHGVEQVAGPASVQLGARLADGLLRLRVDCDVGSLAPTVRAAPAQGVGLANLRARLALAHGGRARLVLRPRSGGGTVAEVDLPCGC